MCDPASNVVASASVRNDHALRSPSKPGTGRYCATLVHMYRSLQIENFRGLRNLELPHLAPVTILTGRNNVGKTAVLEALFLHAGGPRAALLMLTALRPYRSAPSLANIELSRLAAPWETAFYNRNYNKPIRLVGQLDQRQVTVGLSIPRAGSARHSPSSLPTDVTSAAVPGFSYAMRISMDTKPLRGGRTSHREFTQTISAQPLPTAIAGQAGIQQIGGINFDLRPETDSDVLVFAYFISPQGRPSQAELAQRYTNVRLKGLEKTFLATLRAIEPALESIEILATGTPTLYFTLRGGPLLPIAAMGEGMTSVANYAAAIFETPGGLVLIDEIENGIHYSALKGLWSQIGRAVRDTGTQVVASTHSYECVRAAYEAFQDDPDALQLVRLQSGDRSPAAVAALDYDLETLEGALGMNLDLR